MCATPAKVVYRSEKEAKAAARGIRARQGKRQQGATRLVPYRCSDGHWHLATERRDIARRKGPRQR